MLDLKAIRQNPDQFKKDLSRKGVQSSKIDELLAADIQKRELLQQTESLKAQQNEVSKQIPNLDGEEKVKVLEEMKTISEARKALESDLNTADETVIQILESLPNPPFPEVIDGKSDEENAVLRLEGEKPVFDFKPKEHWELAEQHDLLDTEQSAVVSGSRFFYMKNELAILQQALMLWAFHKINSKGYCPTIPPFMTRERAIHGTGYLDRDENYIVNPGKDDLYLIGTSEVPMVSYMADKIIEEDDLPMRFGAYSPCFRREAGTYGKDTKGIMRVHQFEKIEMVVFCKKEDEREMHQQLLDVEEEILKDLGLHYQVIDICCGDLGMSASKKYDLEAWLPGQEQYRELTSTSICTDFQTRRLNIRIRRKDGSLEYASALNGTAVSSRPLIAILEHYQQADGSVIIPECLRPFCGFDKIG